MSQLTNDKNKISFEKKLLIFSTIVIVIMIGITTGLILYNKTNTNNLEKNIENEVVENVVIEADTVEKMLETDTYTTNAITYEEKSDSVQRGEVVDTIRYYDIDGLKDETVQLEINEKIKEKAYEIYKEKISYVENNIDENIQDKIVVETYTYLGFNISNVFSCQFISELWWDSNEIELEDTELSYGGATYSLIDGEEISLEEIFLRNTNITYIIQQAIYEALAWEYGYEDEDAYFDLSKIDYSTIENQVYSKVQKFKSLSNNGEIQYYIDNGYLYVYGIDNQGIEVELKNYEDYVAIYNRYLTDKSIYVDDSLAVSNIFPFESVSYDKYSKMYREVTDDSFIDILILAGDDINISVEDKEKLLSLINQVKEEICASNENFVNMGYVYYYKEDESSNNAYVTLELTNYAVKKDKYDTFFEIIRESYQQPTLEAGIHYISDEYEYAQIYNTSFQCLYNINTKTITNVEYCTSDLNLFENYVKNYDEEPIEEETASEDYVFLYEGFELEKRTGIQLISDMKITDKNISKYNTTYYNYSNYEYFGPTQGVFGKEETYEGYSCVSNVYHYAVSKNYNLYPRTVNELVRDFEQDEIPSKVQNIIDDNNEAYTSIQIDEIDLDNDGNQEYIVVFNRAYDENQDIPVSMACLYNYKLEEIANLAIEKGTWEWEELWQASIEDAIGWLSISNIEYVDIDNDDIMEIIMLLPSYEGINVNIVKYDKDTGIDGEINLVIDEYFEA